MKLKNVEKFCVNIFKYEKNLYAKNKTKKEEWSKLWIFQSKEKKKNSTKQVKKLQVLYKHIKQ